MAVRREDKVLGKDLRVVNWVVRDRQVPGHFLFGCSDISSFDLT